ncbi:MAG TPA: hypothetical protein VKA09_03735 [Nitrososphaeraceae archaeon]|nr:hypothetical protein [Nitrososphaeraceae archaeon]
MRISQFSFDATISGQITLAAGFVQQGVCPKESTKEQIEFTEGILYRNFSLVSIPISSQDFENLNNKRILVIETNNTK